MQEEKCHTEHYNCSKNHFTCGDHYNLRAVLFESREFKEFAGRKSDEGHGDIRQKTGAFDNVNRDQVKAVRADKNTRYDISGHIRKPQPLRDSRHKKPRDQHYGDRNDRLCRRSRIIQLVDKKCIQSHHPVTLILRAALQPPGSFRTDVQKLI